MQHVSQTRCTFCNQSATAECSHCSHTVKIDKTGETADTQASDVTERVDLLPAALYQQALERQPAETDATERVAAYPASFYEQALERQSTDVDATERVAAYPASFYEQALERQSTETDATERVAAYPASFYEQALERQLTDVDATERVAAQSASFYEQALKRRSAGVDATERVSTRRATRLYKKAIEQTNQPSHPSAESQDTPSEPKPVSQAAPRKRSRRRFLSVFHLLADLLLLALLLSLVGLEASNHQTQAQQVQRAAQVLQQSQQYQNQLKLDEAQRQLAQAQQQLAQLKTQAVGLVSQFNQAVKAWGQTHLYHDSYDGHQYLLDSGYMQAGIGSFINSDLAYAQTAADYTSVISETQDLLFDFQMLEADYQDHTAYNHMHASDLNILNHYQFMQKTVLLVSSIEQTMRVYQQGKLIRSFYVTTGRPERPSLPGHWSVLDRRSPTIFESGDPPSSPYWFPETPINYAILYHYGGFFVHDAPWRGSFGSGTQFPHKDANGNTPYNFDGSHGCINLAETDAAWVYHHSDWNTVIVIY